MNRGIFLLPPTQDDDFRRTEMLKSTPKMKNEYTWKFEKKFTFFYLTGNAAITASTMQDVEKPTVSGDSKWDYTKQTHKVSTKATKLATKKDTMSLTNVNKRTKCCAIEPQLKDESKKWNWRSRPSEAPTNEASRLRGPHVEKWKMRNEKWKMKNEKWKMKNEKWKLNWEKELCDWMEWSWENNWRRKERKKEK